MLYGKITIKNSLGSQTSEGNKFAGKITIKKHLSGVTGEIDILTNTIKTKRVSQVFEKN